jgi:hypothetical protein
MPKPYYLLSVLCCKMGQNAVFVQYVTTIQTESLHGVIS